MKKLVSLLFTIVLVFGVSALAADEAKPKQGSEEAVVTTEVENQMTEAEAKAMVKRIEEIRNMDKSELTKTEKKDLRNELREMKKDVRKHGGVIYISGGTLLVIILLIILL